MLAIVSLFLLALASGAQSECVDYLPRCDMLEEIYCYGPYETFAKDVCAKRCGLCDDNSSMNKRSHNHDPVWADNCWENNANHVIDPFCALLSTTTTPKPTILSPNTASLLTFNTGLTPTVRNYTERRTETANAIKDIDADVVCLQEVWFSDDLRNILNVNDADVYPYSVSELHQDSGDFPDATASAPCQTDAFRDNVLPCFITKCSQYENIEFSQCAFQQCDLLQLDQQCLSCIVMAGQEGINNRCLQTIGVQMNEPGLLMLSKYPMTNVRTNRYIEGNATLFLVRAYISAEIQGLGTVVCTHKTYDVREVDFYFENLPQFANWTEQSLDEMKTLVDAFKDESKVVIMGDFNASPALDQYNITGELEGSYDYLVENGYLPTYNLTGYKCTYCLDNIIANDTLGGDLILDHVLVKDIKPEEAMRVLDKDPSNPLSDHYGVKVLVFKNPSTTSP